jgi:hypothetical protein
MLPALLLLFCDISAQEKTGTGTEFHKNVRLVKMEIPPTMPRELKSEYLRFLPLFEEILRENTTDQSADCELTIRVEPGVKMVGSKKTPRAIARVTAFRKNSKSEFLATLMLYSYATGAAVNKDDISRSLRRRILGPAKCQSIGAITAASPMP